MGRYFFQKLIRSFKKGKFNRPKKEVATNRFVVAVCSSKKIILCV